MLKLNLNLKVIHLKNEKLNDKFKLFQVLNFMI